MACLAFLVPTTAAAQQSWTRTITGEPHAIGAHSLLFDRSGNGVVLWQGFDPARSSRPYSALALRATGGAWRRGPDLAGVTFARPGVFTYGPNRLLLVQALERPDKPEASPTFAVAFGSSIDGSFGPLTQLAPERPVAADVNGSGDAIVALAHRSGVIRIVERAAGHSFPRPRTRSPRGVGFAAVAVAINARHDRIVVWRRKGWIEARVRRAGHRWGRIRRLGRVGLAADRITTAIAPDGRILVGWGGYTAFEGHPYRSEVRLAVRNRRGGWSSGRLERTVTRRRDPGNGLVLPRFDGRGLAWAAWTGFANGHSVVKIARVHGREVAAPLMLSGPDAGLHDFATASDGRLGLSWGSSVPGVAPSVTPVARLRDSNGNWEPAVSLTAPGESGPGGTRIAFDPVGGRASVAWLLQVAKQGQLVVSTEAR